MKIVHVYGEDYAALTFEEEGYVHRLDEIETLIENKEFDDAKYCVKVREFGPIDIQFIAWLKTHILDADHCKHENFYIIHNEFNAS